MRIDIFFFTFIFAHVGLAEREHKVHNIILYPEKHSWCQTTPIQQVVASPGYEPATIDNNICVGACFSYSIPKTQPAEPGELIGPYCDSCQPVETKCYHVTLRADSKNTDGPKTFQKRVQIIMNCSCMSCDKTHGEDCEITDQHTLELPSDLFSNRTRDPSKSKLDEVPELLHFTPERNLVKGPLDDSPSHNEDVDDSLKDLLKFIKGSGNGVNEDFISFVNHRYSEDMELDVARLKEILKAYRKNKTILEKHRDFGLALDQTSNNADIEDLPDFGLERVLPEDGPNSIVDLETSRKKQLGPNHHLGDEVHMGLSVGHLVKGPRGSMVLAPDLKVEEKLNIDSDILKPNHDGVVIAYENHRVSGDGDNDHKVLKTN